MKNSLRSSPPLILLFFITGTVCAQTNTFPSTGAAGIGTTTPDASSLLEIKSTSKGILIPRMTKNQRDLIETPVNGLLIYQTNSTPGFYYYNGTQWTAVSPKGVNKSLNNLTTPTAINTNMLADSDNTRSLGSSGIRWKNLYTGGDAVINGITAGMGSGSVAGNTVLGNGALHVNTSGYQNSAVGSQALFSNTTGSGNTANGAFALYQNTTGSVNTANGDYALYSNTNGSSNVATGVTALFYNTTGGGNTANGYQALNSNLAGNENTANGAGALYNNNGGSNNTADGVNALFHNTTGYSNVSIGTSALFSNTTSSNLVAAGDSALFSNSTGNQNVAVGSKALFSNTGGSFNTANGFNALYSNTTGSNNIASGTYALYHNTTGSSNVATGEAALDQNTTGSNNTAYGYLAMFANTTGTRNTANGYYCLFNTTTGSNNTAHGASALYYNTTGYSNVAVGTYAMEYNTAQNNLVAVGDSALLNNAGGYENVAVGSKALLSNTSGYGNTADGYQALYSNTTGTNNTATGDRALISNTTGYSNTALGQNNQPLTSTGWQNTSVGTYSLINNTTGSYNTAVGYNTDNNGNARVNTTCIGIDATATGDNMVRVGNIYVTSIGGQVGWTTLSDGRFKENVKENVPGLNFIKLLRPVTYNVNRDAVNNYTGVTESHEASAKKNSKEMFLSGDKYSSVTTGFIAQEVEQAAKKIGYDFSGVDAPKNEKDMYGLRYDEFVVPLVKAVQEISKMNDSLNLKINQFEDLKIEIQTQNKIIANLQNQIDELKAMMTTTSHTSAGSNLSAVNSQLSSSLQQNFPNPFNHTTTINYMLPQTYSSAKIIVTDKAGQVLKQVNISASGKGSLIIDAPTLSSGAYQYSLFVDGKLIATKQMERIK